MASEYSSGKHIVSAFDHDLMLIQARIAEMGGLAEELLANALDAVEKRDDALAEKVILRDKKLDQLEMEVEEAATQLIALRQPMAQDLRVLISALKIATTLERIGDLAKNIAKRTRSFKKNGSVKVTSSILRMGRATQAQLSEVLNAYSARDTQAAVAVWQKDVDIDEMYNALFREVVTYMMEDSRTITAGSQMLFIAKNLERIGDHTTHISEMIHYIVEGEPLGDERPKGEPLGLDDD
ncbi:phosphate signaling complex protein PhoU [Halovulum dunhuangense]|uniref:Phosphate-specific transport system accessory protein PhoU n=1 Tax=Halovulum dunhuangense TaxID=1505036 RepID=A0A849L0F2_9RHOB|nr:phosphate signaling complex protein PhoU [Halovulum dunhuangense]NNU79748.1 phosphate signaling complex protein PhoU [Halovulum dunhuangense]